MWIGKFQYNLQNFFGKVDYNDKNIPLTQNNFSTNVATNLSRGPAITPRVNAAKIAARRAECTRRTICDDSWGLPASLLSGAG